MEKDPKRERVHVVLAQAYLFYFIAFMLGGVWDFSFPSNFFQSTYFFLTGIGLLLLGPILIFWAQKASIKFKKTEIKNKEAFSFGPYGFVRNPTHLGLFMMMLGFGVFINGFYLIVFSIISFILTKIIFLKKEQKILANKYGSGYLEYKKIVKF